MKSDKLLQHQLRRLDAVLKRHTGRFDWGANNAVIRRIFALYSGAVRRSLKRYAASL